MNRLYPAPTRVATAFHLTAGTAVSMLLAVPTVASGELLGPYGEALKDGTASLDVRYRFEHVDDDRRPKDGNASTVRTRLGYATGETYGLSGFLEFTATRALGVDDYESAAGPGERAVVLDQEVTSVNQAFVDYAPGLDSRLRVGNQRIKLDNDRWVGNVGFRQQEQTYNAARFTTGAIPDAVLDLTYAQRVNRITDFSSEPGDFFFLNARYEGFDRIDVTAYGYLLDFDNDETAAFFTRSSDTYGLRASGVAPLNADLEVPYALEYARQSDAGDFSDVGESYTAEYILAEVGLGSGPWTGRIGYEVLGSDDGEESLQTPLATLHAFNGWTDLFLTNPADGLVDRYAMLEYMFPEEATAATLVYRDLSADEGGQDYGSEIGVEVSHTFPHGYSVGLKYARFSSDDGIPGQTAQDEDVSKLWVTAALSF